MFNIKQKVLKVKNKAFSLPKWLIITIVIALILVIALGGYLIFGRNGAKKASGEINTFTVRRQTIQHTVTGSGSIEPNDQYEITALVKGEILSAHFEEGDVLEKGDIMYIIDSSDQESTMKRAQNSLKQAKSSYNDALDTYNNLTVKSPIGGTVTAVYVSEGDSVGANSKIMDVVNDDEMVLSIPFIAQDAKKLYVGQNATVYIEGNNYTLDGTITYVTSGSTLNSEGVQVSNVEIRVKNPGALEDGDKATAIAGSVACNAAGTFKSSRTVTITAEASGEIVSLMCRAGDKVTEGEKVAKIDSKSAVKQVENAELSLESAQISYDNTLDQLENYTITAPISGTVIQKNSKAGDTLDNSTSQKSMAVIADMSRMTFDISIDELDIQLLEVGQKATITADAFSGQVFSGTVDYISVIGTTSNGVTSYPVTIVLDEAGDLLPGMNVDASIVVAESVDTLVIPVDAVQRNNIVFVKDDGKSDSSESDKSDKSDVSKQMPKANMPSGDKAPSYGNMPSGDNVPSGDKSAYSGKMPSRENMPSGDKSAYGGNMPSKGNMPTGDKSAYSSKMPSGGNMPSGDKSAYGGNIPSGGNMPSGDKVSQGSNNQKPSADMNNTSNTENKAKDNTKDKNTAQNQGKDNTGESKMPKNFGANAPEGFKAVRVELGINNDAYIEVLSGLKEGDVVYVKASASSTQTNQMYPGRMGGGMPSMGGMSGMGGGMPSMGGMSGMGGGMRSSSGMRSSGGMSR